MHPRPSGGDGSRASARLEIIAREARTKNRTAQRAVLFLGYDVNVENHHHAL